MKPTTRLRYFLFFASSALLTISYVQATNLYWDGVTPAGAPGGGAGTWDTTISNTNWDTTLVGADVAWVNANLDTAVFGGTAGAVTLGAGIDVGGLRFDTTGYAITSTGYSLNFDATDNTILFNNIAAATITGAVGGGGNVILSTSNPATAGTLTLNGTSASGWSGTTIINAGMTLALAGGNQGLLNTTGITLNGGNITLTNAGAATTVNGATSSSTTVLVASGTNITVGMTVTGTGISGTPTVTAVSGNTITLSTAQTLANTSAIRFVDSYNRVSDSAGITSNGGTFTYTNTSGAGLIHAETIGSVDLVRGQTNFALTTSMAGGSGNIQTLTLATSGSGLTRSGSTSAVSFGSASGLNTTTNIIQVFGASGTGSGSGQIIGPWASYGTTPSAPTDYAVYDGSGRVLNANIGATAENSASWTAGGNNVTLGGATTLTGTRTLNSLRYTGGALALNLDAFNLETYGILNGGSGTLTVSTAGAGKLTTPTGGGNLYLTPGAAAITVSAPINDNGGAVTLVKSGSSTLTLSSTTSNFSGGVVVNAGTLTLGTNSDANLGATSGGLTFNGTATLGYTDGLVLNANRTVTINAGANVTFSNAITVNGILTGSGAFKVNTADGFVFSNPNNDFSGTITSETAAATTYGLDMASIGDGPGAGLINLNNGTFRWIRTVGGPTTFTNRQFALSGTTGNGVISSMGSQSLTINKDLLVTGVGNKTITLSGTNTGANVFAGNIANGTNGGTSVITVAKAEAGNWIISGNLSHTGGLNIGGGTLTLSGTNTYSGATNFTAAGTTLVFAGTQAVSPNTSFVMNTNASTSDSTAKLLDDTGGVNNSTVSVPNTFTIQNNNSPGNAHTFIVGNNNTANGGTSSGTTTGSTIAFGTLNWNTYAAGTTAYGPIQIRGTDGYRLQINSVVLHNAANLTSPAVGNTFFTPTTANITLGTVTVGTGNTGQGYQTLVLDGTSSDNRVTGAISNASDVGISNRPLSVTKSNTSTWTLSGTNTYTGGTTITTGNLLFSGANSLPTSGTIAVGAAGHLSLADGTARNQTVSALTLTSLGSLSFDWTGSSTGDQLTSTADITPTAGSRFYVNLNRSGTPGGSVTLLTGGAGSTLNSSSFYLANATDYTATLTTPTVDTLVLSGYTSQTPLTTIYWMGNKLAAGTVAGVDNSWALSGGISSNWSSTNTSYTATALTPGATANVIFSNTLTGRAQQSTVLGADLTVNSIVIDDATSVTIAGANGAALTLLSSLLTPGLVDGTPGSAISVTSNANATSTISSRVTLGADQTWHVASGKTLAVSGIVGGGYSLTKASAGTLTLSALPEYTGTTTINAGVLTFGGGLSGGASIIGRTSGITLSQGATLNFNPSTTGINNVYTAGAPITLSGGAGTANIRVAGNDVRLYVSGNVTGQSGVAQTLAITQGYAVSGGDRQNILFSGVIANGGSGGTLGVSVDFAGSSGVAQNAFVNLSGQNTFTGDLTVTNTRGLNGPVSYSNQGAWLTIGGERYSPNSTIITRMGNGYLGGGNYAGNISMSAGTGKTTVSYFSTANQTLGGTISGSAALQMDGTGTLTLSGSSTYTGSTTVNSGTLAVSNIDVVANNNALGKSSAAAANLILRGGTLQYTTGGVASTDRNFALVSSSTIDASGAGALDFSQTGDISPDVTGLTFNAAGGNKVLTNLASTANLVVGMSITGTGIAAGSTIASIDSATQVTLASSANVTLGTGVSAAFGYGSRTLTLTGTNTGTNTIAGNLVNSTAGSGVLSVTKSGAGTWVLSGTNTYTGLTNVNTGTLGGSGSIAGSVTVDAAGSLAPGASAGTLSIGGGLDISAQVNGGTGRLKFELGANTASSDQLAVTGTLTTGGKLGFSDFTFSSLAGGPQNVAYTLITTGVDPTGTLDASNLTGPIGVGGTGILSVSGNNIVLTVTGLGGASPYDTWASSKGLTGLPGSSTDSAKDADPDKDGKNNLYEFAFDGNPLSGANDGKIVGKVATVSAAQVMTLTLPVRTGATFSPSSGDQLSALIDGIYYRIEGDVNLSTFADSITEVTGGDATTIQTGLPTLSSGWTYRTFRAPGTVPATPKAFLRAKITDTP